MMNMVLLLMEDSNSLLDLGGNAFFFATGGDWILYGIIVILMVAIALLGANGKSGAAVVVGMSIAFLLSLKNPAFLFIFWLGAVLSILMLMNGVRKWITGTQ